MSSSFVETENQVIDPSAEVDEVSTEEIISLFEQRSLTYCMLSRLFRTEIDQDYLDHLHSMRFPVNTGSDDVDKGYRLIATFLNNLWDNSLTDLALDYSRTFIGRGIDAFSAAYPFESVYTSEKRLLMQDARDEVLMIYRSVGLDKPEGWTEGEDHISLELAFMDSLTKKTIEALKANNEDEAYKLLLTQRNFLYDHLCAWVPMMTEEMINRAETDLYKGLAYLVEGFINLDLELLDSMLEEPEEGENNASE